jgi:hypothetical protein
MALPERDEFRLDTFDKLIAHTLWFVASSLSRRIFDCSYFGTVLLIRRVLSWESPDYIHCSLWWVIDHLGG